MQTIAGLISKCIFYIIPCLSVKLTIATKPVYNNSLFNMNLDTNTLKTYFKEDLSIIINFEV